MIDYSVSGSNQSFLTSNWLFEGLNVARGLHEWAYVQKKSNPRPLNAYGVVDTGGDVNRVGIFRFLSLCQIFKGEGLFLSLRGSGHSVCPGEQ